MYSPRSVVCWHGSKSDTLLAKSEGRDAAVASLDVDRRNIRIPGPGHSRCPRTVVHSTHA